jgi:tetratricopeptide (TPR) repeat protein
MKLLLYMHSDRQKLVTIYGTSIMIGRSPQNTLVLDEPGIEMHHACLRYEKGTWQLQNLADPATVVINDQPVTTGEISPGTIIHIAGIAIQVVSTDVAYEEDTRIHVPVHVQKGEVAPKEGLVPCPACGYLSRADSRFCPQCGAAVYGLTRQPLMAYKVSGAYMLARLALLCAICGPLLLGVGWLAGIILGILVIARARRIPTPEWDVKTAWKAVGISCGWIVVIGIISSMVSWRIYTDRIIAQNEIQVKKLLNEITVTEWYVKFSEMLDADKDTISEYATVPELVAAGYHRFPEDFDDTAVHNGYLVTMRQSDENDFVCTAVPQHYGITGRNTYWIDSGGYLYHADLKGKDFSGKPDATIERTRESLLRRAGDELAYDLLQAAETAYEKKAYKVCYRIITTIRNMFPHTPAAQKLDPLEKNTEPILAEMKAKELFIHAQQKILDGHIDAALETLRVIANLYKKTSVYAEAGEKIKVLAEEGAARTIRQAGTYEKQGNFDKALALLRDVYRKYPEASVDTALTNRIVRYLDQIQKNREKEAQNLFAEARELETGGDYITALPIYLSIKNRFPDTHAARDISHEISRASRAVDEIHAGTLVKTLSRQSLVSNAAMILTEIDLLERKYGNTRIVAEHSNMLAATKQQCQAYVYIDMAREHYKAGNYRPAMINIELAMIEDPVVGVTMKNELGDCYLYAGDEAYRKNDYKTAYDHYRKYLELDPGNVLPDRDKMNVCHYYLAGKEFQQGQYNSAEEHLRACAAAYGEDIEYNYLYSQVAMNTFNWPDALHRLEIVIDTDPGFKEDIMEHAVFCAYNHSLSNEEAVCRNASSDDDLRKLMTRYGVQLPVDPGTGSRRDRPVADLVDSMCSLISSLRSQAEAMSHESGEKRKSIAARMLSTHHKFVPLYVEYCQKIDDDMAAKQAMYQQLQHIMSRLRAVYYELRKLNRKEETREQTTLRVSVARKVKHLREAVKQYNLYVKLRQYQYQRGELYLKAVADDDTPDLRSEYYYKTLLDDVRTVFRSQKLEQYGIKFLKNFSQSYVIAPVMRGENYPVLPDTLLARWQNAGSW